MKYSFGGERAHQCLHGRNMLLLDQGVPSFVPDATGSTDTGTGPVDSHDEDIQPIWS
jgi:hypothetical protein